MSKTIDISDPNQLSEDDRRYLQERGRLPEELQVDAALERPPMSEFVNTGDANTSGMTADELNAKLKRLAELEAKEVERNLALDRVQFAKEGSPMADDDSEKPYTYSEESEQQLQAELERRGLDPNGDRKTMRQRLVKDDKARAKASN